MEGAGMEKVATDIYTFSRLREKGFTYVDNNDWPCARASGELYSAQIETRSIVDEFVEEMQS